MTTELEKQFFDTFGIEPKYKDYRTKNGKEYECKNPNNRNIRLCYPQITDKQYLELICIANHKDVYIEIEGTDVETMKNNLLKNFIHFKCIIPKHQVQAIFEGER